VLTGSTVATAPDDARIAEVAPRRCAGFRRILLHLSPTIWAYFDILVVAAATAGGYRLMVFGNPAYGWVAGPWLTGAAFCGGVALAGLISGLYERHTLGARSRILVRSFATLGVGLTLAYAFISLFFYGETTRWLTLCVGVSYVTITIPVRVLAHELVTTVRANVLCLGSGQSIRKVVALVCDSARPHYNIAGYVDVPAPTSSTETRADSTAPDGQTSGLGGLRFERDCPRLGTMNDLSRILDERAIDEVVVDSSLTADPTVGAGVLACLDRRCRVTDQPTFVEKYLNQVPADNIDAQWFLAADLQTTGSYDAVKRIADGGAALLGLILTLPFWPLIAVLIKVDSRGPTIYKQRRVGLHGRTFNIYKFRTMRVDAEQDGARWAEQNDQRVTRVGRLLRRSRVDELPQLWNILRGDMSLVGPRPERPEFVEKLSALIPHYRRRHLIKPGLTGWAQIRCGYGASVEDARRKLCYDLYYLKHRSVDLDTAIIIRTIGRFLLGAR
jgi:exopolysaccharide biosynthesis polyprenyl glycosylphosphotransferase